MITQPQPTTTSFLLTQINQDKIDKYLLKLINGEADKLETWLPNILSIGGLMDREKYDYRTTQFKRKDQPQFNSKYMNILQNIEKVQQ